MLPNLVYWHRSAWPVNASQSCLQARLSAAAALRFALPRLQARLSAAAALRLALPPLQARLSAAAALRLALPPRPHRLLEVIHTRRAAMHHDLAELVEHRGGRRVDQRAQQRHLDHGPLA